MKPAAVAARAAHRTAARLAAAPLLAGVEATATNWRLDLADPAPAPDQAPDPAQGTPAPGTATAPRVPQQRRDPWGLTSREWQVLRHLVLGRSNKQIAEAMSIQVSTAGVHVSNIIRKLGVENRGSAAALASRAHMFTD